MKMGFIFFFFFQTRFTKTAEIHNFKTVFVTLKVLKTLRKEKKGKIELDRKLGT